MSLSIRFFKLFQRNFHFIQKPIFIDNTEIPFLKLSIEWYPIQNLSWGLKFLLLFLALLIIIIIILYAIITLFINRSLPQRLQYFSIIAWSQDTQFILWKTDVIKMVFSLIFQLCEILCYFYPSWLNLNLVVFFLWLLFLLRILFLLVPPRWFFTILSFLFIFIKVCSFLILLTLICILFFFLVLLLLFLLFFYFFFTCFVCDKDSAELCHYDGIFPSANNFFYEIILFQFRKLNNYWVFYQI